MKLTTLPSSTLDNKSPTAPNLWTQSSHDKCQGAHTSCDGDGHTPPAPSRDCLNCTQQHPTGRTNCPARDSRCCKGTEIGHWGLKCHDGKPPPPKTAPLPRNAPPTESQCGKFRCPPGSHSCHPGRGGKIDTIDVGEDHSPQDEIVLYGIQANATTVTTTCTRDNTEEVPTYDEMFINVVNCGTVGDTHPEKIMVDDVHAPWCNEAYTRVQLPASANSKGTASLCVKVDTGAGGNMLHLCVFKCLYPNWISPDGLPSGLDHVNTRLMVYNGSHIPLYVHSMAPSLGSQVALVLDPTRYTHTCMSQTPWPCHHRSPII